MRAEFERRSAHMHERLTTLKGVSCARPTGAFYCFPDVSGAYDRLGVHSSQGFCAAVLEKAHVALVPGDAFGMDAHVRLSFANGLEYIDKGLNRLEELLGRR